MRRRHLRSRRSMVASRRRSCVTGAVVATAWTLQRTPIYRGTSSVLVQPVSINRFEGTQRLDQQVNINNEKQVALSSAVAVLAGKFLDSPATPDELLQHASVDVPPNSQVLEIHYSDPIPRTAQRGATPSPGRTSTTARRGSPGRSTPAR